jgi:hypothetical protein
MGGEQAGRRGRGSGSSGSSRKVACRAAEPAAASWWGRGVHRVGKVAGRNPYKQSGFLILRECEKTESKVKRKVDIRMEERERG